MTRQQRMIGRLPRQATREFPDPTQLEAALSVPRPPSMREYLAAYIRSVQTGTLGDDHPDVADELQDFLEDEEEDRVLSDYQLRVLAYELHQAEERPEGVPTARERSQAVEAPPSPEEGV